ncbi:tryptophan synthase subunit alpha [Ammonifex thiophilus]|uniref:Tryptophan synthase alpha chain n=1 Tax=Ammonifex thiophilus TaxID=444093 RepID=A0A3D8P2V7_9THEO|nr:tryptophan synthase subunit alpha [Ammonifex thiophilus]RDV80932.1 tryptophan synthase subunit alpha [Ammonifex thiophilus]
MNRIARTFNSLRDKGQKALIVYVTAGDPSLEATAATIPALVEAGADLIEIGIPFSDPLADGPVIQAASSRALAKGVRLDGILKMTAAVRERLPELPLVFMTYYNPVLQRGLERFCRQAKEAGVDGLIVPDLPYEESGPLLREASAQGLALIPLLAPTSTEKRVEAICSSAQGFVYCVSVTGVTGMREKLDQELGRLVQTVKEHTSLPVAVGFGIARPETAAEVARLADGVVVGSAVVKLLGEGAREEALALVRSLARVLHARCSA